MDCCILSPLDEEYPKRLLQIKNFPKQLYVLGNTRLLNSEKTIAIIGSRECTEYGREQAFLFSKYLSTYEYTIVSGLAIGIDSSAHLGALTKAGKTIAIIGSGFEHFYPEENEWLLKKILANDGCIVSEYPPDTPVYMDNFPKRNRIISAISDCILITEASYRSGSKITAHHAMAHNKKVFCVPSYVTSKNSVGVHNLIREGCILVYKPSQILEEMSNLLLQTKTSSFNVPTEYKEIYELLLINQYCVNDLAIMLNQEVSSLNSLLTMMELEGYIEQLPGNEFKIKD